MVSSTTIQIAWDTVPLIDQNGAITMYQVLYQPLETFSGAIRSHSMNVTEKRATLVDLQESVNYSISVKAYNGAGEGTYSTPVTVTTSEDGNTNNNYYC